MAGMNDILNIDRLPAMPAALAKAIPLLLDPDSSWDALEKVLRQDESLTTAVLRLANSVLFGAPGKHFDLRGSMSRLGRDRLRRCVLEQQVSTVVGGDNAAFGLQRGAMWRSALGGAIAAEELARRHAPDEAGLAFICGLLRDIGKLALNVHFGDSYFAQVSRHEQTGVSFIEAERAGLGFDHAQVGAALARKWRLPVRVASAIERHHNPPAPAGTDHDVLFDIVHAADVICRWAGLDVGVDGMEYRLAEHVRTGLKLDRRSAETEIALVWDRLREAEAALSAPAPAKQGVAA